VVHLQRAFTQHVDSNPPIEIFGCMPFVDLSLGFRRLNLQVGLHELQSSQPTWKGDLTIHQKTPLLIINSWLQ
jgi:hypothetical protein